MTTASQNPLEEMIAAIWADVLNLPAVERDESFFDLGGHSLTVAEAIARLSDALNRDLPLSLIFESPTVAELARAVEALQQDQPVRQPQQPLSPRPTQLPLSPIQRSTWYLMNLAPDVPLYHMTVVISIPSAINADALEHALNEIIRRHEAWRTTFDLDGNERIQVIHDSLPISMRRVDLRDIPAQLRVLKADQQMVADADLPFDLTNGPLIRAALFQLDEASYYLLLTVHHLVCDGYAVTHIVLPELDMLYTAFLAGQPDLLPEPPLHYADYVAWHEQTYHEAALKPIVDYWKKQLHGLPDLLLPGRNSSATMTFYGERQPIAIPLPLANALRKFSGKANATLFMTLLAAFKMLLAYYAQQTDLAVLIPLSGRLYRELEGIMGVLATAVPVRTQLDGAATFVELVGQVRESVLGAYAHQGLSLRRMLMMMQAASPGRQGEILFAFDALSRALPARWNVETEFDLGTAKLDLYLHLSEHTNGIRGSFEYSIDIFEPQTIIKIRDDYLRVLEMVAADPHLRFNDIAARLKS